MSRMTAVLAAAFFLCLGSNLPAFHGHGGGGGGHMGGGHMGGGHMGGGHMGGGMHHGGFSGGMHHSGGFSGGTIHHGGGFSGGAIHHGGGFSGGTTHHFSAPQQHHIATPQHHFNQGGFNQGGAALGNAGGARHSGQLNMSNHTGHQLQNSPSFMSRHNGAATLSQNHAHLGNSTSVHNRGNNGANALASRHAGHQGAAGLGNSNGNRVTHHTVQSGQSFASRHHGNGSTIGNSGGVNHNHGAQSNLAGRHNGGQGVASIADRGARHQGVGVGNHHLQAGAIGANAGRHVHNVNANHFWNGVGRGVGHNLAGFHGHHHGGGVGGNNGGNGNGHHHHGGYYGGNFRNNRLWFGFGTGFWPYYAWNYRPFWGGYGRFGFGFGGLGFGGYGYPGWGFGSYGLNGYGMGYGLGGYGLGYGGYGGYGLGYGNYGYNSYCSYMPGYSIYGNNYGYGYSPYASSGYYGSNGYGSNYSGYGNAPLTTGNPADGLQVPGSPVTMAQINPNVPAGTDPNAAVRAQSADDDFAGQGEAEFKDGNYEKAAKHWRHALLDDPKNGVLVMLLSQSLFASGKYDEAAGAAQQGMLLMEEKDWGVVVVNYKEIYPKIGDYTTQLRALEKARKEKPDNPALRFLLGYHYAFLGYPTEAMAELDKTISLAPQDEIAVKLKESLEAKVKKTATKDAPVEVVPKKPN
jgi:hypothetical protein